MRRLLLLMLALLAVPAMGTAGAAYAVTHINTTVSISSNASAYVSEVITVRIGNLSTQQYTIDRSGLNLTLSDWQSLVGADLVPHIINQRSGIYAFELLPGPISTVNGNATANIYMDYRVNGVAIINQTSPRTYLYKFNASVLNFAQGSQGVVLGKNMRLNIMLPNSSTVMAVYPLPDSPQLKPGNLTSTSMLSWYAGEPLYDFNLVFQVRTSTTSEVLGFFGSIYGTLGAFVYVIIGGAVLLFVIYTYFKVGR